MKISVIVCAAGSGTRAGFNKNKLLAPLYGAPVLFHTLSAVKAAEPLFNESGDLLWELIVTASPRDMAEITAICQPFGAKITEGGNTRTQSVYNALQLVTGDMVLIHDGARPFASAKQFSGCSECVKKYGSAVTAMPSTDTVAIEKDGWVAHIPARNTVFSIQTPQGFMTKDIKEAYEKAVCDGNAYTDDGSVYSRYLSPARVCPCGTAANAKLTFKEDFERLNAFPPPAASGERVGFGVDVHAFGKEQNFIKLCGVEIPCDTGLVAHSDGDVALHAVCDSVLSAAGLNDIGHYFPDTDQTYLGADSAKLFERVIEIIAERGLKVSGLSVSVQAEKPRLSPHIEKMKERIAQIAGIDCQSVAIAAGTCEGLGFVGEGRGICAYCTATLIPIDGK